MALYEGPERRAYGGLSEDEIEAIAERAANKALEKVYAQIGKSVVNRVLFWIGAAALAVLAYFKGSGKL
jgi:hypothetical protein